MDIIYTGEDMPDTIKKSIFLAGPSLRPGQEKEMDSWRKDAIQILNDIGFDGVIFCPEPRDFKFSSKEFSYDDQIEWEEKYLNIADCIVFWVPRDLSLDKEGSFKLPAFTTNIEYGAWSESGKIVLGYPDKAPKMSYMDYYAKKYNVPISNSLTDTLNNALEKLGDGFERVLGERYVPLCIWNTDSFQSWYKSQTESGNRLNYAKVLWSFRPKHKDFVFSWVLQVNIYVVAEDRDKISEFVLARTDISSICLYYEDSDSESIYDKEIVLVKEFRAPVRNKESFVLELPGGSSDHNDASDTAAEEVLEETGFAINPSRLEFVESRQLAATLSSHKSFLFKAKLTKEELDWFKSQKNITHGKKEDSEITYIEVHSINELLKNNLIDWSSLGMILSIM